MRAKLWIDDGLCMRAMRCAFVHPEVFDIDDNGDPVADAPPDRLSDEDMISLAKVCPNEAIVVERSGTYLVGGTD